MHILPVQHHFAMLGVETPYGHRSIDSFSEISRKIRINFQKFPEISELTTLIIKSQ